MLIHVFKNLFSSVHYIIKEVNIRSEITAQRIVRKQIGSPSGPHGQTWKEQAAQEPEGAEGSQRRTEVFIWRCFIFQ